MVVIVDQVHLVVQLEMVLEMQAVQVVVEQDQVKQVDQEILRQQIPINVILVGMVQEHQTIVEVVEVVLQL